MTDIEIIAQLATEGGTYMLLLYLLFRERQERLDMTNRHVTYLESHTPQEKE